LFRVVGSVVRIFVAPIKRRPTVCVPNAFYLGPAFLAVLTCVAAKDKESPIERMFADFGATPFAKTVPVINGGVEVPRGPRSRRGPERRPDCTVQSVSSTPITQENFHATITCRLPGPAARRLRR
jgi:hypothetical protein